MPFLQPYSLTSYLVCIVNRVWADDPSIDTFLLLFISMIIVAASLYLPEHVMKMASRAWFYYAGDETVAGAGTRAGSGAGAGAAVAKYADSGKAGGRMDGQDVLNMLGSL